MNFFRHLCVTTILLLITVTTNASQLAPKSLDEAYGKLELPNYVKHYEVSKKGIFWLHPYLQVCTDLNHGTIEPGKAPYNWIIDANGDVRINIETRNPYGRIYDYEWVRPEDNSSRKKGSSEKDGHVTVLGGQKGRIGGELLYDKKTNTWTINNKSGRYSNHNPDRTPEVLLNAVTLIKQVVDIGAVEWGKVVYLVRYSPHEMRSELLKSSDLQFRRPEKEDIIQKDPFLILTPKQ